MVPLLAQATTTCSPAAERRPAPPLAPLVDKFGRVHRYLRISVIERCNLRCIYCMPPEGVQLKPREHLLTLEENLRVAALFARMGIEKVRLTGGEPLIRRNLEWLIARVAALPGIQTVAMTTNGILLREKAPVLREAGLTQLNVSLDTLRPDRFRQITLRDDFATVMGGIEAAMTAGFAPIKLNAVIMGGVNDDELPDFIEFARDKPINVRFIEYMPFKGNGWCKASLVSFAEMKSRIERNHQLIPIPAVRAGDVAREFRIPGHRGTVGFITSMTQDFCGACDRVRLLADGSIKSCLFNAPEATLRDAMRAGADDAELERLIRSAISQKREKHDPMGELERSVDRSMIEIGG